MIEDHPIFLESMRFIKSRLPQNNLKEIETKVLERLIHTSGDFSIQNLLKFSENACEIGIQAIQNKAPILTDTDMAAAAIKSMAVKAGVNQIFSASKWFDQQRDFSKIKHYNFPNFLENQRPILSKITWSPFQMATSPVCHLSEHLRSKH